MRFFVIIVITLGLGIYSDANYLLSKTDSPNWLLGIVIGVMIAGLFRLFVFKKMLQFMLDKFGKHEKSAFGFIDNLDFPDKETRFYNIGDRAIWLIVDAWFAMYFIGVSTSLLIGDMTHFMSRYVASLLLTMGAFLFLYNMAKKRSLDARCKQL